jgi:hypothetical protein
MQTAAPLVYGQQGSIGATALQLTMGGKRLNNGVRIKALAANTHKVYVGDSAVTTANGFELSAGNSEFFPVNDASMLYVVSAGTGDAVCFEGS